MRIVKHCGFILLSFGLSFAATAPSVSQAANAPSILSIMPGTWTCSSHGSNGAKSSTMTWRRINAQTDQFTFADKMNPNRTGGGVLYYDLRKGQYVNMGVAGPYGWGVSQASGSPTAMKLQWRDTYPNDRNPGGATVTYTSTSVTTHATWSRAGKNMSQDETCTKS